jgi:hypothetical protein
LPRCKPAASAPSKAWRGRRSRCSRGRGLDRLTNVTSSVTYTHNGPWQPRPVHWALLRTRSSIDTGSARRLQGGSQPPLPAAFAPATRGFFWPTGFSPRAQVFLPRRNLCSVGARVWRGRRDRLSREASSYHFAIGAFHLGEGGLIGSLEGHLDHLSNTRATLCCTSQSLAATANSRAGIPACTYLPTWDQCVAMTLRKIAISSGCCILPGRR